MHPKAKAITYLTLLLALVVVVAAGFLLKDRIVEQWYLHRLEHGDQTGKKAAAEKLAYMGSARAVPVIFRLLRGTDTDQFALLIPKFGSKDGTFRSDLLTIRADMIEVSDWVRAYGRSRLAFPVPRGSEFLAEALYEITSTSGKSVIPQLVLALEDERWHVSYIAAVLLGSLGPDAAKAGPALTEALRKWMTRGDTRRYHVARQVIRTLGAIGPDATEAIPALTEAMQDARLREGATKALKRIQVPE